MSKHVVIYSHGFGVRKDDRGLFTDIADAIPEANHVMFDYNHVDERANTLTVSPLQEQVQKLREQLEKIEGDAIIDVVAHSQGCLIAALAKPQNVRQILCLAPPDNVDTERLINFFGNREGSIVDLEGQSRIPRCDGTTTIIPSAYWQSLKGLDAIRLYNRLPDLAKVKFVIANDDEVLGMSNFDNTDERIELAQLDGSHDFTDEARQPLVDLVRNELLNA
ncbi:alpha/beta hydrolase [Candidatus Saccharibacteria bacterium]|nr:alpha/beta hydrolase [Candidatus Saccharibacteria bacterium]MCB9835043.1 alpha/beta hydrolase [Candidatus Nomurabacteria bacterium]